VIVMVCRLFRDPKLGEKPVETWWEEHPDERWQTRPMRLRRAKLLCERVCSDPRQRDTVLNVYADREEWASLTPREWTIKRVFVLLEPGLRQVRFDASQRHDSMTVMISGGILVRPA
jgi:hypothetical protein